MAYSAVASLIQTLEYLVKFPSLAFEMNMHLAKYCIKFSEDRFLEVLPNKTNYRHLPLSYALSNMSLNEFVYESVKLLRSVKLLGSLEIDKYLSLELKSFLHGKPNLMEEEKEKMLEKIDVLEAKLNIFFEIMDVFNIRGDMHSSYIFQQNHHRKELFLEYEKLKEAITFSYGVTSEIIVLCHNLQFLLSFLEDHSTECHHHIVDFIRDVAYGARDLVEASMVDNQIDLAWRESLVKEIEQFFQEKGIRGYLLQTLKKFDSIMTEIEDTNCKPLYREDLRTVRSTRDGSSLGNSNEDTVVVGLDDEIGTIVERLTRTSPFQLDVLAIVGMGGIGKTTLAGKIFDHSATVSHFHCRAWITISQVYNEKDMLFSLLCSVSQPTYKRHEKRIEDIGEDLYRKLKRRRYLIVMDDVWSIESWNTVRHYLPDDANGSHVILTSRSIITELKPEGNHFMRLLDRDQSWKLMERVVFGSNTCPQELEDVGRQIASKCGGLALAIVVVAGLLSRIAKTKDFWEDIADSVKSLVCDDPKQILEILALSYNKLPNYLKECFLYLGVFPEDCEVEVRKLVHLWFAEGLLVPKASKDLEQVGEDYLQELIDRNLVSVKKRSFCGKVKTCHLHNFLRELCLREAGKEKFMHVIPKSDKGIQTSIRDYRRLIIQLESFNDYSVPSFPRVHAFFCFSLGSHFSPDILLFELHLKLLRILDVYFLHFDSFPIQILKLVHLRYLALNLTYDLPASMSQLRNLQAILVCGPWRSPIMSLEYWRMPTLRHLISSVVSRLKIPPISGTAICIRDYIQRLSTISFSSCKMEVFWFMPQLKKLGMYETKEDYIAGVSSKCLANLRSLCKLEVLKCSFYRRSGKIRDISSLPYNLKKLTLSWSYLPWKDMAILSKLRQLQVLKLKNFAFQGPRWELTNEVFGCLKYLLVVDTDLVHWKATSTDHFPCLEHLLLKSCKSLEEIPCGVGDLCTLSLLELHNCSKSAGDSAKEFGEQNEYLKVVTVNEC